MPVRQTWGRRWGSQVTTIWNNRDIQKFINEWSSTEFGGSGKNALVIVHMSPAFSLFLFTTVRRQNPMFRFLPPASYPDELPPAVKNSSLCPRCLGALIPERAILGIGNSPFGWWPLAPSRRLPKASRSSSTSASKWPCNPRKLSEIHAFERDSNGKSRYQDGLSLSSSSSPSRVRRCSGTSVLAKTRSVDVSSRLAVIQMIT